MKRGFTLFILLHFVSIFLLNAQNAEVSLGAKYKQKCSNLREMMPTADGGFYTFSRKGLCSKIIFQKFDKDLNKVEEVTSKSGKKEDKVYGNMLAFGGKHYLLYRNRNVAKKQKLRIYAQELNTENMSLLREIPLFEKNIQTEIKSKTAYGNGNYDWALSNDNSKMILSVEIPSKDRKSPNKYAFKVFDANFHELWSREYEFPYENRFFSLKSVRIDNQGNVYCLGRVDTDAWFNKREGAPTYSYHIYHFNANNAQPLDIPVKVANYFIADIKMEIAENGEIVCGGFYSKMNVRGLEGIFSLTLDETSKQIKQQAFTAVPIETVVENRASQVQKRLKNKEATGKNVELYDYNLDNLLLKPEGGFVLVGEQFFVTTYTNQINNDGGTQTHYVYHYNDIVVFNVAANGELLWTKKIGKRQISVDDGGAFSSYALVVGSDKLHFIFNDNVENMAHKGKNAPKMMKTGSTVVYTLTEAGESKRELLLSRKQTKMYCTPKLSRQISEDEMLVCLQGFGKKRFAKIKLG
jgi:hypothetical protein